MEEVPATGRRPTGGREGGTEREGRVIDLVMTVLGVINEKPRKRQIMHNFGHILI